MRRLFIRPGAIGDCLCWLPALAAIGAEDAEVWAPGAMLPLLSIAPRRRNLASTGFSLLGVPGAAVPESTIEALRGFGEILSWSGWNQPALRDACHRLKLPIRFFPALPGNECTLPVSDWYLQQTREWHPLSEEPEGWRAVGGRRFLLPFLRTELPERTAGEVVIHPFSGSLSKNWPIDRFRSLADVAEKAGNGALRVRWCASPEDPLPGDLAREAWRFESLADLARALDGATAFAGNDSGITHLAAMLGVPCVVFFGPMSPRVWAPRGARVRVVSPSREGHPAQEIPLETGIAAFRSMLEEIWPNIWRIRSTDSTVPEQASD